MKQWHKDIIKYESDLSVYAFRLTKNKEDAKDLVQDTLLRAILKEEYFKENTNLRGWLFVLMKNLFFNNLKKQKRSYSKEKIDFEELYSFTSYKEVSVNLGLSNLGVDIINNLLSSRTKFEKDLFILSFRGYSYKELSARLNVPIGTIKGRLHYLKKDLILKLKKLGYENSKT